MKRVPKTRRLWAFAALAATLLCAQVFSLHHGVEHHVEDEDHACATCIVSVTLKHLHTAPQPTIPDRPTETVAGITPALVFIAPETKGPEARGPPVHT